VSAIFTINFRREAYRLELARTRRRTVVVGTWLAYFGLLAVVLGLYGLNCSSLAQRTRLLEAQNERVRASIGPTDAWVPGSSELAQVERALANPRRWRSRLERLAAVLPGNVMLNSVAVNPDNLASAAEHERLVITGVLRPVRGQDPMQGIMQLVSALHADSVLAAQYQTIRLAESRIGAGRGAPAEFRIECR
jgi:hypothetical protein